MVEIQIKKSSKKTLFKILWQSFYTVALMTIIFGLAYPLIVTLISQSFFNDKANGSLIKNEQGQVIGSEFIGQNFDNLPYFKSRPSACNYDAKASSGTNYGVSNEHLIKDIKTRAQYWKQEKGSNQKIPTDLLTSSASGLDPHISYKAALYQVSIVAKKTGLSEDLLKTLIDENTKDNLIIGDGMVNVLTLNIAVDKELQKQAQN